MRTHMIEVPVVVDEKLVDEDDLKVQARDFVKCLNEMKGVTASSPKVWTKSE